MPKVCCASCFADRGLKDNIIPSRANGNGNCNYCGVNSDKLVAPDLLAPEFGLVLAIYEQDASGQMLFELMQSDWRVFSAKLAEATAKELLADILGRPGIGDIRFVPSPRYSSDRLERWEQLRKELMHENRYFPGAPFEFERVKSLLGQLVAARIEAAWFRARLQKNAKPYPIEEMGAPPENVVQHGRANPAGIPYLYLGSNPQTAAAEIRPHRGDKASIAEFALKPGLVIADLVSDPREIVSPFVLKDEDEVGRLRCDLPFLDSLGAELAQPIVPIGASVDYVPSQYLCEFIKKCGFAGVIYRSSLSKGINLALFDPTVAEKISVKSYDVTLVQVEIAPS